MSLRLDRTRVALVRLIERLEAEGAMRQTQELAAFALEELDAYLVARRARGSAPNPKPKQIARDEREQALAGFDPARALVHEQVPDGC